MLNVLVESMIATSANDERAAYRHESDRRSLEKLLNSSFVLMVEALMTTSMQQKGVPTAD